MIAKKPVYVPLPREGSGASYAVQSEMWMLTSLGDTGQVSVVYNSDNMNGGQITGQTYRQIDW
jgi:hypothetical protein